MKIIKSGDSLVTPWPDEALAHLQAKEGDTLHAIETPYGILVTKEDPGFAKTMAAAEEAFRRYANAYRELAKR
ncbi:MAG TPA: AbrB family transcriptional regulator [Reyranellaceae bacterium]|nr:AbrB family transcriptional regulator [Reyranellaceae bacterium]